jgi:hypothetical protein
MKIPLIILLTCLLLASCSSKTSKNTSADIVATEKTEPANGSPMPSVGDENILTIKGKDIWVRDEPGTGKIVMKLNEDDQCKEISREQFEIIRGMADYWYQIEFNGQKGWVFGSQTDKKNAKTPLMAGTEEELWITFKNHIKQMADTIIESGPTGYAWETSPIIPPNEFAVVSSNDEEGGMNATLTIYSHSPNACTEKLSFVSEHQLMEGAAGFGATDRSYVALKVGDKYQMYPETILGAVKECVILNEKEYFLLTFEDSGDGIAAFRSTEFNIYYVNTDEQTLRCVAPKIGKLYIENFNNAEAGAISVRSTHVQFLQEANTFTLFEYRAKKMKEADDSFQPCDTLKTIYTWNNKTKAFIINFPNSG